MLAARGAVRRMGLAAPFALGDGDERVALDLGSAELIVRGKAGSVQVVPAEADPFLRLMAARVRVRIDSERGARFRLAPGRYLLVGEAGVVLREVELPSAGLELTLE